MPKNRKPTNREKHPAPAVDTRRREVALFVGAIVLVTAFVFGQAGGFEFLNYDDPTYVSQNSIVRAGFSARGLAWAFGFHASNWHPLTWLSLMLDAEIGGVRPGVFHVMNVVWHLGAALLVFAALRRMTGSVQRSGFVALLFAVHPLHVESVAWVAERKDVLSGFFWFSTMYAYAAWVERPSHNRYGVVAASLAAGLMAKPMLVTLPFALVLLDIWPLQRFSRSTAATRIVEKLPLFALSAMSSVVTVLAQSGGGALARPESYPAAQRVENAVVSYAAYLGQAFWPARLSFFYPHPHGTTSLLLAALAGFLLVAVTLVASRFQRKAPYLLIGWLFYVGTLVPVSGLVQVGIQARADRYTYIPLVGIFVALVWGAYALGERLRRRRLVTIAGAAVVLALAAVAHVQAGYWRSGERLYTHALALRPDNAVAHNNLASVLLERGDAEGAVAHAREALRLDPGHPEPPITLGNALAKQGKTDEAIAVYRRALEARPTDPLLRLNLGAFLGEIGKLEEAEAELREAARLAPEDADVHRNLGVLMARRGRYREAVEEFSESLRLDPSNPEVRADLERARSLESKR